LLHDVVGQNMGRINDFKNTRWIIRGGVIYNFSRIFLMMQFAFNRFIPCIILYLTFFYTREERTVRLSLVLSVATCAAAFNAVFASSSEVFLNGYLDISGWRWMFFMEGEF
jgi:hypothetical protein